jgi:hypothetical protein
VGIPELEVLDTAFVGMFGKSCGMLFGGDSFGQEELGDDSPTSPTPSVQPSRKVMPMLAAAKSGSVFQSVSAVTIKLKHRGHSVVAVTDCQLLELDPKHYFAVFNSCPTALMPQTMGAMAALKVPGALRSPLQLAWIRNFMSQQRFLSQLPADSIDQLSKTVSIKCFNKGEYGALCDRRK